MVYPYNLEQKLGFDKIREKLAEYCESSLGQALISEIQFNTNRENIEIALDQTFEFVGIIEREALFPNSNYIDISSYLKKAAIENTILTEEEFFELILMLKTLNRCLDFFKENRELYPELTALTHPVYFNEDLLWSLDRVFDDIGKLKDNASDRLYEIRKGIAYERQRLRKSLSTL